MPLLDSYKTTRGALGERRFGASITVLATVLGTGVGGVVLAGLHVWTDSVLPPMGLHWALNGLGIVVAWWLARVDSASHQHPHE